MRETASDVRYPLAVSRIPDYELRVVYGYHLIFTAYGWWLPNDPRGSMSHEIRCDILAELGVLHYGRKKIQPPSAEIRRFYQQAAQSLKHPLLDFSPAARTAIAESFGHTIQARGYTCYACAVMWDHVHLCIRKHRDSAETMISHLQDDSRDLLLSSGLRPKDHPVWGGPGWKVYIDSIEDFWRTIRYIEGNPIAARWAPQIFPFVTPYDNWPDHKRFRGGMR